MSKSKKILEALMDMKESWVVSEQRIAAALTALGYPAPYDGQLVADSLNLIANALEDLARKKKTP